MSSTNHSVVIRDERILTMMPNTIAATPRDSHNGSGGRLDREYTEGKNLSNKRTRQDTPTRNMIPTINLL
jgi:hypothetical protein